MKIYTKTGDKGKTSLFSGERVDKFNERVELYGTVDELLAIITLTLEFEPPAMLANEFNTIRNTLFTLSADFATKFNSKNSNNIKRITEDNVVMLENWIDKYCAGLPETSDFIMPGGCKCSAFINLARTVCRRAERLAVRLANMEQINQPALLYLNRLSDYLFIAMRYCNFCIDNG